MSNDTICIPKSATLGLGAHGSYGAGTCAMELVDYLDRRRQGRRVLRGDVLTDKPACVCPVIGAFVRSWNDGLATDADRNRLLLPLLPLLLDTKADAATESRRAWMACDWLVRVHLAAWLELAGLGEHAQAVRGLAELRDEASARAAQPVIGAAWSAARSAAWSAARSAARSAAWSAARSAAWSAARSAAESAARSAAESAAWSAARSAAWSAARSALDPPVRELQASAQGLVRRMCLEATGDDHG